jgi:hypothetical protein
VYATQSPVMFTASHRRVRIHLDRLEGSGIEGSTHSVFFRADVHDGDHPFLIGCPTLISMNASLDFGALLLKAKINGKTCSLQLHKRRNHLFICNQSESLKEGIFRGRNRILKQHTTDVMIMYGLSFYCSRTTADRKPGSAPQNAGHSSSMDMKNR